MPGEIPRVEEDSQETRRRRKTHAKVRTGCFTCKIRRKKCDEAKPACLRCLNTGRKCDGYAATSSCAVTAGTPAHNERAVSSSSNQKYKASQSVVRHLKPNNVVRDSNLIAYPRVYRLPSTISFSSDTDFYCFDFFRRITGPQMAGYFESHLYRQTAVRIALLHPVALKAGAAVGAAHQRFIHGISREAFEFCDISNRLHHEAIRSMTLFMREGKSDPNYAEVLGITACVFALFEAFQGNYDKSVEYTIFGLKAIWNRPLVNGFIESRRRNVAFTPVILFQLTQSMHRRAVELFGSPPNVSSYYTPGGSLLPIPARFGSMEQARDCIFSELECILQAPFRYLQVEEVRRQAFDIHIARILHWSAAYAELVSTQPERTRGESDVGHLLKHVRDLLFYLFYLIFYIEHDPVQVGRSCNDPDSLLVASSYLKDLVRSNPKLAINFNRIVMLHDSILDSTSIFCHNSQTFSVDSGIGPTFESERVPEASVKTRHLLKRLLKQRTISASVSTAATDDHRGNGTPTPTPTPTPIAAKSNSVDQDSNSQLWQTMGVYSIAEALSAVEEHAIIAAIERLMPRNINPWWVDVTLLLDEKRLLLRYCRANDDDNDDDDNKEDEDDNVVAADHNQIEKSHRRPRSRPRHENGMIWVQQWLEFRSD